MIETGARGKPERAYLVAVEHENDENMWSVEDSLDELASLARTAGAEVVGKMIQRLRHPDVATYLGKGKVQELSDLEKYLGFNLVIFDDELSPSQQRNLEKALNARVIDRTALILDIFAQHAHTREGRLQVELAQLEYRLPRLAGSGTEMSRLGGGSRGAAAGVGGAIGVRGPGETKLEIDRRRIRGRISDLREEIESVREARQIHRRQRAEQAIPVVAVVGYTNAGKSTLFNVLTEASVVAENKLFATLDPMTRRVKLAGGQEILLTDTVGFLQHLPTTLVAAFRATLEEVTEADLLVHVVDASSPSMARQIEAVEQVLEEIGAGGIPMILALNKADLLPADTLLEMPPLAATLPCVRVSALNGTGGEELLRCISDNLVAGFVPLDVLVPYSRGDLVALFHQYGTIDSETYDAAGTHLRGHMPANHSGPLLAFQQKAAKRMRA